MQVQIRHPRQNQPVPKVQDWKRLERLRDLRIHAGAAPLLADQIALFADAKLFTPGAVADISLYYKIGHFISDLLFQLLSSYRTEKFLSMSESVITTE